MDNPKLQMVLALDELRKPVLTFDDPNFDDLDYEIEIEIGNVYVSILSASNRVAVTSFLDDTQIVGDRIQIINYLQRLDVINLTNIITLADDIGL